jgi:hypothetical protein
MNARADRPSVRDVREHRFVFSIFIIPNIYSRFKSKFLTARIQKIGRTARPHRPHGKPNNASGVQTANRPNGVFRRAMDGHKGNMKHDAGNGRPPIAVLFSGGAGHDGRQQTAFASNPLPSFAAGFERRRP